MLCISYPRKDLERQLDVQEKVTEADKACFNDAYDEAKRQLLEERKTELFNRNRRREKKAREAEEAAEEAEREAEEAEREEVQADVAF